MNDASTCSFDNIALCIAMTDMTVVLDWCFVCHPHAAVFAAARVTAQTTQVAIYEGARDAGSYGLAGVGNYATLPAAVRRTVVDVYVGWLACFMIECM